MTVGSTINYTALVGSKTTDGSISSWLNHSAIQAVADTIVAEAEAAIYRELRHWRMLTSTTGTMTSNPGGQSTVTDYIPIPADYLEDKVFYITGVNYQKMTRKTIEEVIAAYGYDGSGYRVVQQPMWYFNDQTNIKFDSPPDFAYPYLLYYYQQPASLATTNTNFITQFYPRLLRCATCAAAAEFMKDAGVGNYDRTWWVEQFQIEIQKAQIESDRSVRSQEIGMILT
jgi:hypothetical protein